MALNKYNRDISVIIPAAGSGKRMHNKSIPKAFMLLAGQPLLTRSLNKFILLPAIKEIIIAVSRENMARAARLVSKYKAKLPEIKLVKGGKERCDSVANALKIINPASRIILIHDAARPLVKKEDIIRLVKAVRKNGAAILAVPVVDTIKRVNSNGQIKETLPRQELWAAQTPQGFKRDIIMKAYNRLLKRSKTITDDASLVEHIDYPVRIVPGSYTNLKITTPADKIFAQKLLNFTKV